MARTFVGGVAAAVVLTACGSEPPSELTPVTETQPEGQAAEDDPTVGVSGPLDLGDVELTTGAGSASVDGSTLSLAYTETDLLGEVGGRVAPPGLHFVALGVEVANPLDDRAAPGVADGLTMQIAVLEGEQGCPEGATSEPIGDGSRWCLLPSTLDGVLSGDVAAGERRTVRVVSEVPLHRAEIIVDHLAVAATAGEATVLMAGDRRPSDAPTTDGDEGVRGRVQIGGGEAVEGVRVVVLDEERRLVGDAISDTDGEWEVDLSGPGDLRVMLDQRTLPEGVELRDPTRDEVVVTMAPGQRRTVLFALR